MSRLWSRITIGHVACSTGTLQPATRHYLQDFLPVSPWIGCNQQQNATDAVVDGGLLFVSVRSFF